MAPSVVLLPDNRNNTPGAGHFLEAVPTGPSRPTGVLDVAGVVHWLVQHFPSAVYNLPPVSNPATQEREGGGLGSELE